MRKVLIFGAGSAIAHETGILFARNGDHLYLVDIKDSRCKTVADDINSHFPTTIHTDELDANNFDGHQELIDRAVEKLGGLDVVLIAHGTLPDQEKTRKSAEDTLREFSTNCTSVISLSTIISNYFEEKGKGTLAVISSVAGDRGRQSNYIYGAAKGGVTLFLQGLRNRLNASGIKIITIKPGMVDTPMTANMPKGPLFVKPHVIAKGIFKAINEGKDVSYIPSYWFIVMTIIRHIPEFIFKKLNL